MGGRLGGQRLAELFRNFIAARLADGPEHRAVERLDLIHDERVLDDVAVSRDRIRTRIGEAHWFYDKER